VSLKYKTYRNKFRIPKVLVHVDFVLVIFFQKRDHEQVTLPYSMRILIFKYIYFTFSQRTEPASQTALKYSRHKPNISCTL